MRKDNPHENELAATRIAALLRLHSKIQLRSVVVTFRCQQATNAMIWNGMVLPLPPHKLWAAASGGKDVMMPT